MILAILIVLVRERFEVGLAGLATAKLLEAHQRLAQRRNCEVLAIVASLIPPFRIPTAVLAALSR